MTALLADADVLVRWTDHSVSITGAAYWLILFVAFAVWVVKD